MFILNLLVEKGVNIPKNTDFNKEKEIKPTTLLIIDCDTGNDVT